MLPIQHCSHLLKLRSSYDSHKYVHVLLECFVSAGRWLVDYTAAVGSFQLSALLVSQGWPCASFCSTLRIP